MVPVLEVCMLQLPLPLVACTPHSLCRHSIREMCGVDDVGLAYRHFVAFFEVRAPATQDMSSPNISLIEIALSPAITALHVLTRVLQVLCDGVMDVCDFGAHLGHDSVHRPALEVTAKLCGCHCIVPCTCALSILQDFTTLDQTLDIDSLPPAAIRGTITDTECRHMHTPRGPLINPAP
jgi:hypothetical protein